MRKLLSYLVTSLALIFALTACGNRTPLQLPKPDAKPPAKGPAESSAK